MIIRPRPRCAMRHGAVVVAVLGLAACQAEPPATRKAEAAWSATIGGTGMQVPSSAVLAGDRFVVAGSFDREVIAGSSRVESQGGLDSFVASFANDAPEWVRAAQGPGDEVIRDAVGSSDGIAVAGLVSPGGTIFGTPVVVDEGTRPFVAELSLSGDLRSLSSFSGSGFSSFSAVARGPSGQLYVGGGVVGRLDLGGTMLEARQAAFIAELGGGRPTWVLSIIPFMVRSELESSATVSDISLDDDGSIFVSGLFTGVVSAGPKVLIANPDLARTPYLLRLSSRGELLFASTAAGDAIAAWGHESHPGIAHSDHGLFEVDDPAVVPVGGGGALLAAAFGLHFGGTVGDFEAPAIGEIGFVSLDETGAPRKSALLRGQALIAGKLDLIRIRDERVRVVTSWAGDLALRDAHFSSDHGRSVMMLDWNESEGLTNAMPFELFGRSVTSDAACAGAGATWSATHVVDVDTAERDALVVRFAE